MQTMSLQHGTHFISLVHDHDLVSGSLHIILSRFNTVTHVQPVQKKKKTQKICAYNYYSMKSTYGHNIMTALIGYILQQLQKLMIAFKRLLIYNSCFTKYDIAFGQEITLNHWTLL